MLCGLLLNCGALSVSDENQLGQEVVAQVNASVSLENNVEVNTYIQNIVDSLEAVSGNAPHEITVRIIREDAFSAFAVPAGNIYITTGTISGAHNVAELASILAHEIAHVSLGHITENYNRYRTSRAVSDFTAITLAIATANPFIAGAGDAVANVGSTGYITAYSRDDEEEADSMAFQTMLEAGYDPRSQLSVFIRLQALSAGRENVPPFLLSHPLPQDRIAQTRNRLDDLSTTRGLIINDGRRLQEIKQLLR